MTLRCPDCGAEYADRWRCACGAPLEYAAWPQPAARSPPDPAAFDAHDGLWSFADLLPVDAAPDERVTLGEGTTPLVDAAAWEAEFKLEYVSPTGSFKDRGATATITRAAKLGVERLVEDSSGNAGAAIATYAARADIDATIYVPADAADAKLRSIRCAGADVIQVDGDRADVTDACLDAVRDGWYASHVWNPAFAAGTATFAFETALQQDWSAPDAVVVPVGNGTLLLGAYFGYRTLVEAGWIDAMPRLLGAQAAGVAPVVADRRGAAAAERDGEAADAADGIRIEEPARMERIREAIEATGGDAIAVTGGELDAALDRLHGEGFYVEPTAAVAPAALDAYRERGVVAATDDVVVPLTGSGLKK